MANRKLTALPELTVLDDNDWDYAVDISDLSESPQGTSKKVRKSSLWDYIRGKSDDRYSLKVPKIQFTADGITATYDIGVSSEITAVFWNGALLNDDDWSQTDTEFTLTFTPDTGAIIKPI